MRARIANCLLCLVCGLLPACQGDLQPVDRTALQAESLEGLCGGGAVAPVRTAAGEVLGCQEDGYRVFRGIPYAIPPVGDLRWRAPQPITDGPRARRADTFGPSCPQPVGETGEARGGPGPEPEMDEDCLTLNVWAPEQHSEPAPVMVWIHGGSFLGGSGSRPYFDGRLLAGENGVVLVTLNYRLGVLGFLAHPDLAPGAVGNFGLLDQRLALEWVRDNIAAFGGDPDRVTLFGVSAGAASVCRHRVSPGSWGLFQGTIQESGTCGSDLPLSEARSRAEELAADRGCPPGAAGLACLREVDADDLIRTVASGEGQWVPVVDGTFLPAPSAVLAILGRVGDQPLPDVPLMVGANADEGTRYVDVPVLDDGSCGDFGEADLIAAAEAIDRRFGGDPTADRTTVEQLLSLYPPENYDGSYYWAAADLIGDARVLCPARVTGMVASAPQHPAGQPVDVWQYLFAHDGYPLPNATCTEEYPLGAWHGVEVRFVFGAPEFEFTPEEEQLSERIRGYWTHFAATVDQPRDELRPGEDLLAWPRWEATQDRQIVFDTEDHVVTAAELRHAARCDGFWYPFYATRLLNP